MNFQISLQFQRFLGKISLIKRIKLNNCNLPNQDLKMGGNVPQAQKTNKQKIVNQFCILCHSQLLLVISLHAGLGINKRSYFTKRFCLMAITRVIPCVM